MGFYVYIARIEGLKSVYKVGLSRHPLIRMGALRSQYKRKVILESVFAIPEICGGIELECHDWLSKYKYKRKGSKVTGREVYRCNLEDIRKVVISVIQYRTNRYYAVVNGDLHKDYRATNILSALEQS